MPDPKTLREALLELEERKGSKYHNIKTTRYDPKTGDVIAFDSHREANRYDELCWMVKAGKISDLRRQVRYELLPSQKRADGKTERAVYYIADFVYNEHGVTIVEDAKGAKTPDYILKRKLLLWVHGITIREV